MHRGSSNMDNETISSGLRLVGENGLYVVPDHPEVFSDEEFRVYAYEANPFTMRSLLGGLYPESIR